MRLYLFYFHLKHTCSQYMLKRAQVFNFSLTIFSFKSIGFEWTYITVGGCLLGSTLLIYLITPEPRQERKDSNISDRHDHQNRVEEKGHLDLLKIPEMYYAILSLFSTAASIGFITGTLEAHLEQVSNQKEKPFHSSLFLSSSPPRTFSNLHYIAIIIIIIITFFKSLYFLFQL